MSDGDGVPAADAPQYHADQVQAGLWVVRDQRGQVVSTGHRHRHEALNAIRVLQRQERANVTPGALRNDGEEGVLSDRYVGHRNPFLQRPEFIRWSSFESSRFFHTEEVRVRGAPLEGCAVCAKREEEAKARARVLDVSNKSERELQERVLDLALVLERVLGPEPPSGAKPLKVSKRDAARARAVLGGCKFEDVFGKSTLRKRKRRRALDVGDEK